MHNFFDRCEDEGTTIHAVGNMDDYGKVRLINSLSPQVIALAANAMAQAVAP